MRSHADYCDGSSHRRKGNGVNILRSISRNTPLTPSKSTQDKVGTEGSNFWLDSVTKVSLLELDRVTRASLICLDSGPEPISQGWVVSADSIPPGYTVSPESLL